MWNHYPKGSHKTWPTLCSIMANDELEIKFAKNKCLGTIWSTEMIPIA